MTTTQTDQGILDLLSEYGMDGSSFAKDLLAAMQARNQQGPIKTWQERLEETCPALGPMHIHASVEEVNDAMQAEIAELRSALQEQAREGEAVAWSDDALNRAYSDGVAYGERNYRQAIATYQAEASGYKDAYFKLVESIANLKVFEPAPPIIIAAPQPEQPSEPAQPVAQPNIQNQIVKDISRHEPCHTCAHYQQGKLPGVRIHDETCYECRSYWGNKWEAA